MLTLEDRYTAARDKFFAENPQAMREIEAVSAEEIEGSGMTVVILPSPSGHPVKR